jgi:chromosome segregation ATPase
MPVNGPAWGELIVGAVTGGGLKWIADAVLGRKGVEVKALGATIGILSAQQALFAKDLAATRQEIQECHDNHRKCEEDRELDRRQIEDLKDQIATLMDGPPASYRPGDLRRVPGAKRRVK